MEVGERHPRLLGGKLPLNGRVGGVTLRFERSHGRFRVARALTGREWQPRLRTLISIPAILRKLACLGVYWNSTRAAFAHARCGAKAS